MKDKGAKGEKGVFSDPNQIAWRWIGKGDASNENDKMFYHSARVIRKSDGSTRTFSLGDAVYVASEPDEEAWVAHIVEFFELGCADEDVEIVDDTNAMKSMRCTLRWLYNAADVDRESLRLNPNIPKSVTSEVYFSDHVEKSGSNGLEVIEGRAFLCSTVRDMKNLKNDPPENYWAGDAIRLVRCFYGNNNGSPPPVRELEKKELQYLLEHPSTDTHMYRRSRPALHGVTGAVMKGTGKKRRYQHESDSECGSTSNSAARYSTKKSPGHPREHPPSDDASNDGDSDGARRGPPPGKNRDQRVECFGEDSDFAITPSPKVRNPKLLSNPRRVIETIEKSGNSRIARSKQQGMPPRAVPDKRAQQIMPSPMDVDTRDNEVMKSPEGEAGYAKLAAMLKTKVAPDRLPLLLSNLRPICDAILKVMRERDLSFNIGEQEQQSVANLVAQQVFGQSAPVDASHTASLARIASAFPPAILKSNR